jgi:hypothetical protein
MSEEYFFAHILEINFSSIRVIYLQAPYFFPLMLFKMERCSSAEVKLHVLQTIPKLATHKVCFCVNMELGRVMS